MTSPDPLADIVARRTRELSIRLDDLPDTPILRRQLASRDIAILRCRRDGSLRAPLFQFPADQAQRPMVDVWTLIERGADEPWDAVVWMETAHPELAGLSPAEYAHLGGRSSTLFALARPVFPWR